MKRWTSKRRSRKRPTGFNPNRQDVADAVNDFVKKGGTITKIVVDSNSYSDFVSKKELPSAADDFLNSN